MARRDLVEAKYGSETVTNTDGVDHERIQRHATQLVSIGRPLIVVTSGAVRAGRAEAPDIEDDQILAGIGSADIVIAWKQAFRQLGRRAAQVLVTDHEISDRVEGRIFFNSLTKLVDADVIPVVNTNDLLSDEELPKRLWKGENDGPAAHIGRVIGVSNLLLLTEKNGIFTDDGLTIGEVPYSPAAHQNIVDMVGSRGQESQGIAAKVKAAVEATHSGIETYVAGADEDIGAVLAGETGTHFVAKPQDM